MGETKPTFEEIDQLADGEYLVYKDSVYVRCNHISGCQISFTCPFCWTKYNKNGEVSKRAKRSTHRHGAGGILKRGESKYCGHKCSHCYYNKGVKMFPSAYGGICPVVTPSTWKQ